MNDEDDLVAAEFALGLLDESEAAQVMARARTDAALSLRIAWWRDQLAPLSREIEAAPRDGLWQAIAARLPGNDNGATVALRRWRAGAIGATGIAAALLVTLLVRPVPQPAPPAAAPAPVVVALAGQGGAAVAVSYDGQAGRLTVAPALLDPGAGDAELWIIPEGGTPRSLGVIDARLPRVHEVAPADRAYVTGGATFAITQEAKGGSPDGKPKGPVVASGTITRT